MNRKVEPSPIENTIHDGCTGGSRVLLYCQLLYVLCTRIIPNKSTTHTSTVHGVVRVVGQTTYVARTPYYAVIGTIGIFLKNTIKPWCGNTVVGGGAAARDDGFIFREVLGGRGAFKQTEKNAKESVERRKNPIVKNIKRITCWRRNAEYRNRSSKTYNLRSIIRYTHYR